MLDVSGVAHLFGGEAGLLAEIEARFERQGFGLALGLADAPRAAWALARYSNRRIAPAGLAGKAFVKLFHEMPVAALGLEEADAADMARAGLRRIGDLAMRPRAPIAARFGVEVLAKLDALNGLERDAISPRFAAPDFCAERRFASPIAHVDAVMATLARLADDLVVLLERQAKGARLEWSCCSIASMATFAEFASPRAGRSMRRARSHAFSSSVSPAARTKRRSTPASASI